MVWSPTVTCERNCQQKEKNQQKKYISKAPRFSEITLLVPWRYVVSIKFDLITVYCRPLM